MAADERSFQEPEYDYYDLEDEEEEGGRGPILVVVAVIVAMAFVGVVLVAYQQGKREGRQEIPQVLRADSSPMKVAPPSDIAGADAAKSPSSTFFADKPAPESEKLAAPPEEPIAAPKPGAPDLQAKASPITPAPTKNVEVKPAEEPAAPGQSAVAAKPVPAAAPPAAASAAGDYLVQIGSFHSKDEALATWDKIKAKNSDILSVYSADIVSADLGPKGVYQRLRFGPFQSRDDAAKVCDQLKTRKQDCLLAKR